MASSTSDSLVTKVISDTVSYLTSSTFDVMMNTNLMIETTARQNQIMTYETNMTSTTTMSSPTTTESIMDLEVSNTPFVTPTGTSKYPSTMLGITAACAFIIALLGTCGNFMTIVALALCKKLRTRPATAFVINLAVVEMIFCIFILPLSGAQYVFLQYTQESLLPQTACKFFTYVRYSLTQVELQTILGVALTRAFAVSCTHFFSRIDHTKIMTTYIILIWIYSFAMKLPTVLGLWGTYAFNNRTMECDLGTDSESKKARSLHVLIDAIIPVLLIIVLYIYIFIMVIRQSYLRRKRLEKTQPPSTSEVQQNSPWLCCCIVKKSSFNVIRASMRSEKLERAASMKSEKIERAASNRPSTSTSEGHHSTCSEDQSSSTRKTSTSSFQELKKMVREGSIRSQFSRKGSRKESSVGIRSATCRRDLRVARTIFIVFLMILVCSVPVALVHGIDKPRDMPDLFLGIHILYWLQYCLNPVIYVVMNQQYRDAYVGVLIWLIPSWKHHRQLRFSWEKPNVQETRNTYRRPISERVRKCNPNPDPVDGNKDRCLPAIPEGSQSKISGDDDVFISEANGVNNAQKVTIRKEDHEDGEETTLPLLNGETIDCKSSANIQKDLWVTPDGIAREPNGKGETV